MSFNINISDVLLGLTEFESKTKVAMGLYADAAAKKLETEAKNKATWIDRTGLSRKTITGGKQWEGNKCIVYVAGNTQHFPFLELCNDKKYSVLKPTVDTLSGEILRGLTNLFKR